jgi:penicillin-binding protein 2
VQLAFATAILAHNGVVYKPHIGRHVTDARGGDTRAVAPQPVRTVKLNPKWVELVRAAMVDVTKPGGTAARSAAGAAYAYGGKTGSAQVIAMKQNEVRQKGCRAAPRPALFIAFAPAAAPTIALGILVENGGHGSATAAPIARMVLDYYLLGKLPEKFPDLNPDAQDD